MIQPKFQEINRDLALQTLERDYQAIQHPAQTGPLAFQAVFWNEAADKKGCNFFVGEIRTYPNETAGILSAYAAQDLNSGDTIRVIFIERGTIQAEQTNGIPLLLRELEAWSISPDQLEQPLYLVYIYKSEQSINCP